MEEDFDDTEQEDLDNFWSTAGHFYATLEHMRVPSDGMDDTNFSKRYRLVVDMVNAIDIEDVDDCLKVINHWKTEMRAWFGFKVMEANMSKVSLQTKRDDRHTALACYAAYMSVELVMDELYYGSSYRYCGAKRTIKCIQEAILVCFNLLCKNLLIGRSSDVVSLRDSITKAADFATDYLCSQGDELHFKPEVEHDQFLLWFFQGDLTGNFGHVETFSLMEHSTKASYDDVTGLSGDLTNIKDRLLRSQQKLDIIPIVGMGGIGKTTLTRKVYEDPKIMAQFHIRAWVVISQEFCERNALLDLLESTAELPNEMHKKDTEQLAEILYRRLKGWRYFIVLDDIWTIEAWNDIKLCFPDDNNGSRIVLTSRITEVASHVDSGNPPHFMNFLGIEDSWDLLRKKVYGKNACPRELINIGMQIAEKSQGLPLAIEMMAGHLSNVSKTVESWEDFAKRLGFPREVTHMKSLTNILSISYNDLPHHLKACFLTMVNFPKNFEIPVRKLVQMWAAMGFLHQKLPNSVEESTMEEVAMNCLNNLIDRSLIMVRKKKFDGKAKLCGIHDLLWDLSMMQFRKEGHYIFGNKEYTSVCDDYRKYVIGICQTVLYSDLTFESDYPINFEGFKQLRVLDILNQAFDYFPIEITVLVNLRYLSLATSSNIPDLICNLSKLETLVNYHEGAGHMLPKEIWLLARLRHLHVGTCTFLPEPPSVGFVESCEPLLPNLQSLSDLSCSNCTEEVFMNIPHLKQLKISESEKDEVEDELLCSTLENLVKLHQLEGLKLCCNSKLERPRHFHNWGSFLPNTIKKLTLSGSNLPWSEMNALSVLPNLEVLKLQNEAFKGHEWDMEDQKFLNLKHLFLDALDLIFWNANSGNFPNLQWLHIRACPGLCRIPKEFGETYTLELIDIEFCNQLIYHSAIEIQREQMDMGNDKLIVRAGRAIPQLQMTGFFMLFVWLAMNLKSFKPQRDYGKKKTMKLKISKL